MIERDRASDELLSLGTLATELFSSHVLLALRGPYPRGAVPAEKLADKAVCARNTIVSHVKHVLNREEALPLDLVIERVFALDLPEQNLGWEQAFSSFAVPSMDSADDDVLDILKLAFKAMMGESFRRAATPPYRDVILAGYVLQAAALLSTGKATAAASSFKDRGPRSKRAAESIEATVSLIHERRRASYEKMHSTFLVVLRWALRMTRRRAKAPFKESDIVIAMHSLFDGYMIRHLLDPEAFSIETLVEETWELAFSMSEPGFLHPPAISPEVQAVVEAALSAIRIGRIPLIEDIAELANVEVTSARHQLRDDDALLNLCLDTVLAGAFEIVDLATTVPGASKSVIEAMLTAVQEISDEYEPLIDATADAPAWRELGSLIESLLVQETGETNLSRAANQARQMLMDARLGSRSAQWKRLLNFVVDT